MAVFIYVCYHVSPQFAGGFFMKGEKILKEYKVTFTETIIHTFFFEAESEEDAENKFLEAADNCEIDFSDGEVSDSEYYIAEV